jgi:hypothetical protein
VSRDFWPSVFFHQNIRPGLLIKGLKPFRIYIRIREDIRILLNACGVIDTACMVHAVSLIPHNKFVEQLRKVKIISKPSMVCKKKLKMHAVSMTLHGRCMRCHWSRMHDACGIIDTACTTNFSNNFECGVIDTACTVHDVDVTFNLYAILMRMFESPE